MRQTTRIQRPHGPFRLRDVPREARLKAATAVIRREQPEPLDAIALKLAAIAPSDRLYVLTGERA